MKNSTTDGHIGTTARALLNDCKGLRYIIAEISCTQKQRQEKYQDDPKYLLDILTDTQINDAFCGPFHSAIQQLSGAYALIATIRTRLTITQDDNLKSQVEDSGFNIPENINADINAAALDKKQRQLDDAAKKHYQQWQDLINKWLQNVIMQITMNGVNLSENEINDIQQIETLSELIERFTELKLELPKNKKSHYNLSDYFTLKIILCIQNSLARQHITNRDEEQQKILKKLKDDFKNLEQEETQLSNEQKKDIDEIIKF